MERQRQLDPASLGDHIDRLYRAALALCGTPADAEDLVQETFARVLRRPRWLRNEDDVGYLLRALRNTFITSRRLAQRRPQTEAPPDSLELIEDHRARTPLEHLESLALYETIAALPPGFRDALVAVDLVGLSYQEAARALGVREGTLTTRLHRARLRVARALTAANSGVGEQHGQGRLG
jgi:RNA polymerase sigma-70 factor (ECF subfamily)